MTDNENATDLKKFVRDMEYEFHVDQFNCTRNAFFFWRAYRHLRKNEKPLPEDMLRVLDGFAAIIESFENSKSDKQVKHEFLAALGFMLGTDTLDNQERDHSIARHIQHAREGARGDKVKEAAAKAAKTSKKHVYDVARQYGLTNQERKDDDLQAPNPLPSSDPWRIPPSLLKTGKNQK